MIRNTKIQLILLIVAFVSAFSSCTKENANETHSPTQDSPAQKGLKRGHKSIFLRLFRIFLLSLTAFFGYKDETESVYINGKPGVYISVTKQSGTNAVKVADALYEKLAELKETLPSDIQIEVISDDSTAKIVQYFSSVAEREVRKYKTIVASTGTSEMEDSASENKGSVTIYLPYADEQIDSASDVKRKLESHFAKFPGTKFTFRRGEMEEMAGQDIDIVI